MGSFNLNKFIIKPNSSFKLNVSSNGQFIVQRKILSEVYPDFPDVITFKLYLYLCKAFEWKYMRIKKAKTVIQNDLKLSAIKLNNSLHWLEQNHFIKRSNNNIHQMYQAEILTAPDYDLFSDQYISCEEIEFHIGKLKIRNHGYIMIPSEAITDHMLKDTSISRRDWSYLKLKVLLQLYSHCWFDYFGGINPEIINVNYQSNSITVAPSFCYCVKATEKQIVSIIIKLLNDQLFKLVPVVFEQGIYKGDNGLLGIQSKNIVEKMVLRPFHISEKKLKTTNMLEKRGLMYL